MRDSTLIHKCVNRGVENENTFGIFEIHRKNLIDLFIYKARF